MLARRVGELGPRPVTHQDLENPEDLAWLREPMQALKGLSGLVILDEAQRVPEMLSVLRVLADRSENFTRFLVLCGASPELLRQGSESLAGRVIFHRLKGFSLFDSGIAMQDQLWMRGGFPRSFLAASEEDSVAWRRAFIRTFLDRDLPQLGVRISAETLRRFWTRLAHRYRCSAVCAVKLRNECLDAIRAPDETLEHDQNIVYGGFSHAVSPNDSRDVASPATNAKFSRQRKLCT
jgi:uncharacterized protein